MDKPEDGWASWSYRWSWDELSRLQGRLIGEPYRDEHGEGFWLIAADPPTPEGVPVWGTRHAGER